jgi:hypothetical protein
MSLGLDPEIATALAPMAGAMADATPPAVGDVKARRAMWEPIIGAAGTAQPIPADVTTADHHATAGDGARITMRWSAYRSSSTCTPAHRTSSTRSPSTPTWPGAPSPTASESSGRSSRVSRLSLGIVTSGSGGQQVTKLRS